MKIPPSGPVPAEVLIVGEAPGRDEVDGPFEGASGQELTRMLHEGNLLRSECRLTNVCSIRPPNNEIDKFFYTVSEAKGLKQTPLYKRYPKAPILEGIAELKTEILQTKPSIILALGNTALWALTGKQGIRAWRGSFLEALPEFETSAKILPAYHPAYILHMWSNRGITIHDFTKIPRWLAGEITVPKHDFTIHPSLEEVISFLGNLIKAPQTIAADIETRHGHIACIGIGTSSKQALCIPFMKVGGNNNYWSLEGETQIVHMLWKVLTHPEMFVVWQNGLYDIQYIWRWWRFFPNLSFDTMLAQHAAFPGMLKGLDFLASMYCNYHIYWKDEGKEWNKSIPEERLWTYNCLDCVATFEVWSTLRTVIKDRGVEWVYKHSMSLCEPILYMMLRGVKLNMEYKNKLRYLLEVSEKDIDTWLKEVLGHPLNPRSSPQMRSLFIDDFQFPAKTLKGAKGPTLNDDRLSQYTEREPLVTPLVEKISASRSIRVYRSTFAEAQEDPDKRMRCSYNIAGTETGRLSSSKNAFWRGMNLENIPKVGEEDDLLPNVRRMFIPDTDYILFDIDLRTADAQVVAWESGDEELMQMFREGVDIHAENARVIGMPRHMAKQWVHATNYGATPRTCAIRFGITTHVAETARTRWFSIHPGIRSWQEQIKLNLQMVREISNRFGRKRYYFDRIDQYLVKEALAWIPQSTVADVTNIGLRRIYHELPQAQLLLQNHDSVVLQIHKDQVALTLPKALELMRVEVPYPEPLVIPVDCRRSHISWGDLKTLAA